MEDLKRLAAELRHDIDVALERIKFAELDAQETELSQQIADPNFWQDSMRAQEITKRQAGLDRRLQPWRELKQELADIDELVSTNDESLLDDLRIQLTDVQRMFDELKAELKFTGPYDEHAAIVSIHAGAGGTDAQDWAQMLLRMYVRCAEKSELEVKHG